ncbi:MAG: FHA domain-containing protein [Kineosporiaceae bacterium]
MSEPRGLVAVDEVVPLAVSARAEVLADLVRVLTEAPVHEVRNVGADQIVAMRRVRPLWATVTAWVLALPTLGLGLLLLRVRRESSLSLRLLSGTQGVDLALEGTVERATLERLRGLRATVASRTPRRPTPMVAPAPVASLPSVPAVPPGVAGPSLSAGPSGPAGPGLLAPPPAAATFPGHPAPAVPLPDAAPAFPPPSSPLLPPPPGDRAGDLAVDRTVRRGIAPVEAAPAPAAVPAPPVPAVVLDSGERVDVDGVVLVGRDPAPAPGESGARLVRVADPGRSVSKTHLSLHPGDGVVWLVDRHSTNGVELVEDGRSRRAEPGVPLALREGVVARFGDRELRVAPLA